MEPSRRPEEGVVLALAETGIRRQVKILGLVITASSRRQTDNAKSDGKRPGKNSRNQHHHDNRAPGRKLTKKRAGAVKASSRTVAAVGDPPDNQTLLQEPSGIRSTGHDIEHLR